MIYIDTESTSPYFNFAVEEYFTTRDSNEETIFLFWRTNPTVMLGKYQNAHQELNLQAIERDQVHVVRRVTGGGTIYTELGGWQFSFIENEVRETISFAHYMDPIIESLAKLGITAEYNSRNDLTLNGKKISGNAQCVRNGHTLHHGSLLYQTDLAKMMDYLNIPDYKIKSKGIKSVRDRTTNIYDYLPEKLSGEEFREALLTNLFDLGITSRKLTEKEKQEIETIAKEKFESWEWNFGKAPEFTIEKSRVFVGGKLTIQLEIRKGLIKNCQFSGDFFSLNGVSKIEKAMIGLPYRQEVIEDILLNKDYDQLIHEISTQDILSCLF